VPTPPKKKKRSRFHANFREQETRGGRRGCTEKIGGRKGKKRRQISTIVRPGNGTEQPGKRSSWSGNAKKTLIKGNRLAGGVALARQETNTEKRRVDSKRLSAGVEKKKRGKADQRSSGGATGKG